MYKQTCIFKGKVSTKQKTKYPTPRAASSIDRGKMHEVCRERAKTRNRTKTYVDILSMCTEVDWE